MATKQLQLEIPEFITIQKYSEINSFKDESNFGRLVWTVSKITGKPMSEVRLWSIDSLTNIVNIFSDIADHKEEFHTIIEWNGELLGYAHMRQATLGEYIDLEHLCKDLETNMHKVAAILYRPITKHKFKDLSFTVKQKIKMLNNKVENVFDHYTLETYDSEIRKEREESFKDFPAHIFLGAVSFFLNSVNLYSINTLYSEGQISLRMKNQMISQTLEHLSLTTGAGGGLSTTSLSPTFYQLQGIGQSPT